jgi:arginyl-tRNA synthetase
MSMRGDLEDVLWAAVVAEGWAGSLDRGELRLERPRLAEHGDFSTGIAMLLARRLGTPPRVLAAALADRLTASPPPHVASVEIAGPGFVNLRVARSFFTEVLVRAVEAGTEGWARPAIGQGARVQVEFVSANPTGPLHMGNGWLASYGDALARLLERTGHEVTREYYVNDTGGQIRTLGRSLLARRRGEEVGEGGYQGEYLVGLAAAYEGPGVSAAPGGPEDAAAVLAAGRWAAEHILEDIRATLERLGIVFDSWFSQASIEEGGAVEETVALLGAKGLLYEEDGALMVRTTDFGDTRDRVLRKSAERGGDYTYLAGDLAYHRDKFLVRGFDRVIDVFGADHAGQVASLQAGVAALGVDPARLEIRLGQMVSLLEGGEEARMSKRSGHFVAVDELVDALGAPAVRLLSLVSSIDQATSLDLAVVREQAPENPVFYVQYAHARIASIARVAADRGVERRPLAVVNLSVLDEPRELALLRALEEQEDVVAVAARERAPHRVTAWVRDLAARFHGFYHDCRVLGDDVEPERTQARLWLVEATRVGLAVALDLLGVDAPQFMGPSDDERAERAERAERGRAVARGVPASPAAPNPTSARVAGEEER